MSNLTLLPEDIRSEFSIDEQGKAFATRRAIARLASVSDMNIVRAFQNLESAEQKLSRLAETIAATGFKGAEMIPDYVASEIIGYYAMDAGRHCTEQAKKIYRVFAAVGFRTWIQTELGWQKQIQMEPEKPQLIPLQPDSTLLMVTQSIQALYGLAKHVEANQAMLQQQQQQINQIFAIKEQAEAELKALPMAESPAPEKPTRAKINEIVRNYCQRTNADYSYAWNKLYKELYYRCGVDIKTRSKTRKMEKLDVVAEAGLMDHLHAIASELLCG